MAGGIAGLTAGSAEGEKRVDSLVVGISGAGLAARGIPVIDDYGASATARLTAADAAALEADGVSVSLLDGTTGRGAFRFDAREGDSVVPAALRALEAPVGYYLVAFRGPVKAEWADALAAEALRVYDYVPHNSYVVKATAVSAAALDARPEVVFVGAYHPAYKIATYLEADGVQDLAVLTFPGEDLPAAVAKLAALGVEVSSFTDAGIDGVVKARADASLFAAIAKIPEVSWIEPAFDGITLDNADSSAITQTGAGGNFRVHDKGIDGSSQKLSVCDTGVDTQPSKLPSQAKAVLPPVVEMVHEMYADPAWPHVFYNTADPLAGLPVPLPAKVLPEHRKIALYYSPTEDGKVKGDNDDSDGHGTHTAGTIAGDAPDGAAYNTRNKQDGVAFNAKLVVCDITTGGTFNVLNDYSNYWTPAYSIGSRVNSNSWGSPHTTSYTEKARQHDAYAADNRDFLVLRSAGNVASTLRPESVAKNAMGIAASNNLPGDINSMASFSGQGPTQDGRFKPNVAAPGACLDSAARGTKDGYTCLSGTSMSTPTVAGAAGLVRDYFEKGYYPTGKKADADKLNPTSALVRAVLQISGRDMTGSRVSAPIPNSVEGWGRVTLDDALFFEGDSRKMFVKDEGDEITTGSSKEYMVSVAAGQQLRVMIAWTDEEAAAGANPALVNDLDLTVRDPSGNTYKGNAFVGGVVPPNSGSRDTRNVEEAVYVNSPGAGSWTVTVTGANVPKGPQKFALVVTSA